MTVRNFGEHDVRVVARLLTVLDRFRLIRHTMPVHLVTALLRVALEEGKSVQTYAIESGVSQSVMSRHLLELGTEVRNGEAGLGLVEKRTSPRSLRETQVFLTPRGRKVIADLVTSMEGPV